MLRIILILVMKSKGHGFMSWKDRTPKSKLLLVKNELYGMVNLNTNKKKKRIYKLSYKSPNVISK